MNKDVWDVTRAIPTCAVTGEAAGTAAALALEQTDGDAHSLTPNVLQAQLRRQGAILDASLMKPEGG